MRARARVSFSRIGASHYPVGRVIKLFRSEIMLIFTRYERRIGAISRGNCNKQSQLAVHFSENIYCDRCSRAPNGNDEINSDKIIFATDTFVETSSTRIKYECFIKRFINLHCVDDSIVRPPCRNFRHNFVFAQLFDITELKHIQFSKRRFILKN